MSEIKKALEKARKEKKTLSKEALEHAGGIKNLPEDIIASNKVFLPAYSQTKSVQVDLKKLINRKVFSILKKDEVADQYKFLMTRILNKTRPDGHNTIEITSFKEGEGKSLTCVNLAITLARESRQTVLLVDMDLRRPSIHSILGIGSTPGLKDYFLNATPVKEMLIHPGIERLTVLPAGGRMDNSTEIMDSHRMEALIHEIKTRYKDRYIIFDAPALNVCSDPLILASHVDTIALVARSGYTTTEDITSGMALLKDKNILGIILNDSGISRGWTY